MKKITTISDNCIKLIEYFECSGNLNKYLKAYKCPSGVWTIGIGTTIYPNGIKVKKGNLITRNQAYEYFRHDINDIEKRVDSYTSDLINQNQFDALVSFAYNEGCQNLKTSTLLRKINKNVNDSTIQKEFARWFYDAKGKIQPGLIKRRNAESTLYFKAL